MFHPYTFVALLPVTILSSFPFPSLVWRIWSPLKIRKKNFKFSNYSINKRYQLGLSTLEAYLCAPPPIPRVSSQSFKQCSYVIIMCRVGIWIKKLIIKNKNKHPHQSIMHSIHIQKKDTWMKISTWWGQCTFLVFLGYILGFAFTFYLMGGEKRRKKNIPYWEGLVE